jgi:ABC-type transport system involved in multi-copper enzyme maturation permease subunit
MSDLITMMQKEVAEFFGNRRFLSVFAIAVLAMGVLPALTFARHGHASLGHSPLAMIFRVVYVLFATAVVVAQTAPDLVLHERVGHTLDYLLTTRLPDYAIFGAKVIVSFIVGYLAAMLALVIQLIAAGLVGGSGWHWLFLSLPLGRVVAFGMTADLSLYVAVVGTFVALRVGEQRAAYMVSIFSVGLLIVPFLVGWLHFSLTMAWGTQTAWVFGGFAVALFLLGLRAFRRDLLVLYLQE